MRWRSAFSLWFWNSTFLGCVHREERFRPGFILPAQPRCGVQKPNQIAVGIQVILLCGFNQTVDHSAGLGAGGGVGKEPVLPAHDEGLCAALGTEFTTAINAQAIVIGLCFANGLSPVSGKYGWWAGVLFGALHYALVTSVPFTHGGFLLYNGGFTAGFICMIFLPGLEGLCRTIDDRRAAKAN